MIYTDGVHLISDVGHEELHSFAQGIGLKRCWFQNPRDKLKRPHYDLTTEHKRNTAIAAGAKLVSATEIVLILRKWREEQGIENLRLPKKEQGNE